MSRFLSILTRCSSFARLRPTQPDIQTRDTALEGLRGVAAFAVLLDHLASTHAPSAAVHVDPVFRPPAIPFAWVDLATLAVLIFFLLSGYVIGLSVNRPYHPSKLGPYFARRALRILPVYLAAVVLGWVMSPARPTLDALGHLLFLQNSGANATVSLLAANPPLWSLAYEAAFYLVFPLLWLTAPPLLPLLLTCGAVCLSAYFWSGVPAFPAALAGGACYWIAGLSVAWLCPFAAQDREKHQVPWPTAFLLTIATWKLDVLGTVLRRLNLDLRHWPVGFEFAHLAALPVSLWLLCLLSRRQPRFLARLELFCWALPGLFFIWRLGRGTFGPELILPAILFTLAAVLRGWKPGLGMWRKLAPVGAVSYGLYAFGYPLQLLVRSWWPDFSGTVFTWLSRVLITLILTVSLAWYFELKLQPWLRARWLPSRP